MEYALLGLFFIAFIVFFIVMNLVKRLIGKGVGVAVEAGRKAIFKEQIAESHDLVNVPLVLTSSATPAEILAALDATIHPSKTPPSGFDSILYEAEREPMRVAYNIGNKKQPHWLAVEIQLSECDGSTQINFRVLHALRQDGVFVYKEALKRLREQVQYVAASAGDSAKVAEGVQIYRAADPTATQQRTTTTRVGAVLAAGALFWAAVGIEGELIPVWFLLAGVAGYVLYIGRKPVAKQQIEGSAAAEPVIAAQPAVASVIAKEPEPVVEVEEPSAEEFLAADNEDLADSITSPLNPKVFMRVAVASVAALVIIIVIAGMGSKPAREVSAAVPQENAVASTAGDAEPEVNPNTLSPDYHAATEDDMLWSAPEDGSVEFADVVYFGAGEDNYNIVLEYTIVSRKPAEWYIASFHVDLGYYIDDVAVTDSEFIQAIEGAEQTKGLIVFDKEALYELHIFTKGQSALTDLRMQDQMVTVPDYKDFNLTEEQWNTMEWADALSAYISTIEHGFAHAGLVGDLELQLYTGVEESSQEPAAGTKVPAGTRVHIVMPVAD